MKKIIFNVIGTIFFLYACFEGYQWYIVYGNGAIGDAVTSVVDKVSEERDALIDKRMEEIRSEAGKRLKDQRADDPEVIAYKKEKEKFDSALGNEVGDDRDWYVIKKGIEEGQSYFCEVSDGPKLFIDAYNKQQEILGKPREIVPEDYEVNGVIVLSTFASWSFYRGKERCQRFVVHFQNKKNAASEQLKRYE